MEYFTRPFTQHLPHKINIQTLIAHLEAQPEQCVMMDRWLNMNRHGEKAREAVQPECGTVQCIGGAIWLLMQLHKNPDEILDKVNSLHSYGDDDLINWKGIEAGKWIGLGVKDAAALFLGKWSTCTHALGLDDDNLGAYTKSEMLAELRYLLATGNV